MAFTENFRIAVIHRGEYAAGTAYVPLDEVSYNGSTYRNKVACSGVLPTNTTNWNLISSKGDTGATGAMGAQGIQGIQGVQGIQGTTGTTGFTPSISRSSTTSNAIGTGSKTFTYSAVADAIGWVIGSRLRIYNDATHYMEGVVTSVSTSGVTLTVDRTVGTGTFTSWTIGLTGDVGATGNTGSTGESVTSTSFNSNTGILTINVG